jgi:hypothetical protein
MINHALAAGYVQEESRHTVKFPSVEAAKLFVDLCQGIDYYQTMDISEKNMYSPEEALEKGWEINGSYRYTYVPKLVKKAGKIVGCDVTIIDIGQ